MGGNSVSHFNSINGDNTSLCQDRCPCYEAGGHLWVTHASIEDGGTGRSVQTLRHLTIAAKNRFHTLLVIELHCHPHVEILWGLSHRSRTTGASKIGSEHSVGTEPVMSVIEVTVLIDGTLKLRGVLLDEGEDVRVKSLGHDATVLQDRGRGFLLHHMHDQAPRHLQVVVVAHVIAQDTGSVVKTECLNKMVNLINIDAVQIASQGNEGRVGEDGVHGK
jgi:hypothetical protein